MFHDAFKYYNSTMLVTSSIIVNTRVLALLLTKGHSSQLLEDKYYKLQNRKNVYILWGLGF